MILFTMNCHKILKSFLYNKFYSKVVKHLDINHFIVVYTHLSYSLYNDKIIIIYFLFLFLQILTTYLLLFAN